jgi:hypothetical protein
MGANKKNLLKRSFASRGFDPQQDGPGGPHSRTGPSEAKGPSVIRLEIPAANGLIVLVSCVVGFIVYCRSATAHPGAAVKRDLAAALGATATCVVVLAFLFGLGDGSPGSSPQPAPAATPTDRGSPAP